VPAVPLPPVVIVIVLEPPFVALEPPWPAPLALVPPTPPAFPEAFVPPGALPPPHPMSTVSTELAAIARLN
jgi:hypothetical protein